MVAPVRCGDRRGPGDGLPHFTPIPRTLDSPRIGGFLEAPRYANGGVSPVATPYPIYPTRAACGWRHGPGNGRETPKTPGRGHVWHGASGVGLQPPPNGPGYPGQNALGRWRGRRPTDPISSARLVPQGIVAFRAGGFHDLAQGLRYLAAGLPALMACHSSSLHNIGSQRMYEPPPPWVRMSSSVRW